MTIDRRARFDTLDESETVRKEDRCVLFHAPNPNPNGALGSIVRPVSQVCVSSEGDFILVQ